MKKIIQDKVAIGIVKGKEMYSGMSKKKLTLIIIGVLVVGLIGYNMLKPKDTSNIQVDTVKKQNIKETVLTTGQVVSSTNLSLSFKGSGIVQRINVIEGQKVTNGQILATLSQSNEGASYTQARGSLAAAEANYQKVLAGASSEDVAVAQATVNSAKVTLDNAKKSLSDTKQQQETLVNNAHKALVNSTLTATPQNTNFGTAPTISGSYNSDISGTYIISFYGTGNGLGYKITGLESSDGNVSVGALAPMGTRGLYVTFPSSNVGNASDIWIIEVPNTKATNYITNLNIYNAAVQAQQSAITSAENVVATAQSSLDQANASLNLRKAQARPADIAVAQAQILSAQGQVQAAGALLDNTIIRAPANGTITSVKIKIGELATAQKEAIILQDITNLHTEADVSEANIAQLKPDQSVDVTFDALGPDRHFVGKIQSINPGATIVSGVVNYKVTVGLDNVTDIKPGMTANMTILIEQKDGALAIQQRAVQSHDGKKFVRVIDDTAKKTFHEVEVTTGLQADGGLLEITSGLTEGQTIVTFIKQ